MVDELASAQSASSPDPRTFGWHLHITLGSNLPSFPCPHPLADGLPQLPFDAAAIITPALAAAFSDVCPPLLDGLLWTARHYDFLPR